MCGERKLNPIESFPIPFEKYCNSDWACVKLAEKIGKEGSPRNLNHIFRKAIANGIITHFYPSRGALFLLRSDVIGFIESYNPSANVENQKTHKNAQVIDYEKIKEIVREVIKEEFSK